MSRHGAAAPRSGDATSLTSALVLLIALLPISVACLAALVYPLSLWRGDLLWLIPAYYCAVVLIFLPGVEDFMWRLAVRGLREPTPTEQSRLRPAWLAVLEASGQPRSTKYRLRVLETEELNAMAAGGRQVFVTTGTLESVPQAWLPGVLAHELGHHVGLHPIMLSLEVWLLRPIHWVRTIANWLSRACAWSVALARGSAVGMVIAVALFFGLRLVSWVLLAVTWVPLALLRLAGRQAEYRADAYAAEIGFRAPLGRFLSELAHIEDELGVRKHQSLAGIVASTHPPTKDRIERLRAWQPASEAQRRAARSRSRAASGGQSKRQEAEVPTARPARGRRAVRVRERQRTTRRRPPHGRA